MKGNGARVADKGPSYDESAPISIFICHYLTLNEFCTLSFVRVIRFNELIQKYKDEIQPNC